MAKKQNLGEKQIGIFYPNLFLAVTFETGTPESQSKALKTRITA